MYCSSSLQESEYFFCTRPYTFLLRLPPRDFTPFGLHSRFGGNFLGIRVHVFRYSAALKGPIPHGDDASLAYVFCFLFSEEPDRVRTLLEDVENMRRAKMYEGMGAAAQEVQQAVKVGGE